MREYAAAPAYNAKLELPIRTPPAARSYSYWARLIELQDWREKGPCWRSTDVGACLEPTDNEVGLCDEHLEELRNW